MTAALAGALAYAQRSQGSRASTDESIATATVAPRSAGAAGAPVPGSATTSGGSGAPGLSAPHAYAVAADTGNGPLPEVAAHAVGRAIPARPDNRTGVPGPLAAFAGDLARRIRQALPALQPHNPDRPAEAAAAMRVSAQSAGSPAFHAFASAGRPGPVAAPSMEGSSRPSLVRANIDLAGVNRSSTAYSRFRAWVDNAVNGNPGYDFHPGDAAVMFLITREVRYCNTAVDLVEDQVAAAEAAIAAGSMPVVAYDSYLEVGPLIADLALAYQTCSAQMSASQRQRWAGYAEQAVWNVWHPAEASWGGRSMPWSGWSIDNPGNNYHFSFLEATMYWALASGSRTWFDFLKNDKLPALRAYYAGNPGGGSREGTGYGTAQMRLFDIYALWRKSTGEDLSIANTYARNSIDYWIHATVPTLDRFAPIGDQARVSVPELYDYQRHLMLSARYLTLDPVGRGIADWWLRHISVPQMGQGANLRYDALLPPGTGNSPPAQLHYAANGTGHVFARTGWDTGAMWMAFVAGPYNESHAHQDQGAFTLFSRGDWLAVTENIWSHSGINQGTEVHNVLRFERSDPGATQCAAPSGDRIVHQCEPSTSTATVTPGANGALTINADLTPAYRGNPAVRSWRRRLDFAGRRLVVLDNFSLGSGTRAFFQVNVPVQPTIVDSRTVTAGRLRIRVLQPSGATIRLHNWNASNSGEFSRGWRVDIGGGSSVYQVELAEN